MNPNDIEVYERLAWTIAGAATGIILVGKIIAAEIVDTIIKCLILSAKLKKFRTEVKSRTYNVEAGSGK